MYHDVAHAPSKVEAATEAVKAQYPDRKLLACVELHASSSLNSAFLAEYHHTLGAADVAAVYINTNTPIANQSALIPEADMLNAFNKPGLRVFTETADLETFIKQNQANVDIFLMMSSAIPRPGTFGGMDLTKLV